MPLSDGVVNSIYVHVHGHTLCSREGIVSLIRSVEHVIVNNIPGALLECGVFVGGNIQAMIKTVQACGRNDIDIYAYDTFKGMPKPEAIDFEFKVGPAYDQWKRQQNADSTTGSRWVRYSLPLVLEQILPLGYPRERLHFVRGMVEKTIPRYAPEKIALARFDTDFYSSTRHEFEHLYPRVSPGGIIYIDDYGAFLGSQTATDEYIKNNNLPVSLVVIDEHVRMIVKP